MADAGQRVHLLCSRSCCPGLRDREQGPAANAAPDFQGQAAACGAATGSEAAEQEDLELDLTEDELEAFGSSSKEAKRAAKKKAREDAKEAKRLEKADKKERATKNKKAQTLCSKANVQLAAALRDLEKAQQKATKAKATKLVLDNLREQTRVLTTWKKKAVDGVLHFAKQGLEGPEYELPFDDQVLKDELTSVKSW